MNEAFNRKEEKVLSPNLNFFYSKNELMEKLYMVKKSSEKKNCENEKIMSPLFMKSDKCFIINRNPLSPYITEKVIFSLCWKHKKTYIRIKN